MSELMSPEEELALLRNEVASLTETNGSLAGTNASRAKTIAALEETNARLKAMNDRILYRLHLAMKGIVCKRERVEHSDQLSLLELLGELGVLPEEEEPTVEEEPKAKPRKKRSKHGRRRLDESKLPVVKVVLKPEFDEDEPREQIGEEVSSFVEYRPASYVRVEVHRPKYRDRSGAITIAPVPERAAPRSMAGPGLLSHVLVSKFGDHLPLYRQEQICKRNGLHISRSTLCDWVKHSAAWLEYITDAMWLDVMDDAPYVLVDSTGVLVQAPRRCKRTHFYTTVAPGKSVLFRHVENNDGDTVADLYDQFTGFVHADASSVFHELYRRNEGIIEVGCWAHARRNFFDVLHLDRERALVGIGWIGKLYSAQQASKKKDGDLDGDKRRRLSRPILARLFRWARAQLRQDLAPPVATAIRYLINHRRPLTRFLDDARLRLDNNLAELALRHEVIGRKNWIFCGSDDGARWNTVAVSLIATCRMHDIEPWAYLRDVLTLIPGWSTKEVIDLAPQRWNETRQRKDVKRRLERLRPYTDRQLLEATAPDDG